ncbi:MAG: hypothetical protein EZS28_009199 [Streblomastix strix]|uniref:Uncharacterized protein n=1 Tax=Streblomastix strix TaxID=222440 RepID=A0A5J4WK89_9EUKA|nr:MAG: hypothetical protein EZS28_009199 [Streblomastix strix]
MGNEASNPEGQISQNSKAPLMSSRRTSLQSTRQAPLPSAQRFQKVQTEQIKEPSNNSMINIPKVDQETEEIQQQILLQKQKIVIEMIIRENAKRNYTKLREASIAQEKSQTEPLNVEEVIALLQNFRIVYRRSNYAQMMEAFKEQYPRADIYNLKCYAELLGSDMMLLISNVKEQEKEDLLMMFPVLVTQIHRLGYYLSSMTPISDDIGKPLWQGLEPLKKMILENLHYIIIRNLLRLIKNEDLADEKYLRELQLREKNKQNQDKTKEKVDKSKRYSKPKIPSKLNSQQSQISKQNENSFKISQSRFVIHRLQSFIQRQDSKKSLFDGLNKPQQEMDNQPNIRIELPPSQKVANSLQEFGVRVSQLLNAICSLPHKNGYERWETSEAFAEGLQMGIMRYMLYLRDPLRQNSHIWGIREKVRMNGTEMNGQQSRAQQKIEENDVLIKIKQIIGKINEEDWLCQDQDQLDVFEEHNINIQGKTKQDQINEYKLRCWRHVMQFPSHIDCVPLGKHSADAVKKSFFFSSTIGSIGLQETEQICELKR